MLAERGQWTLRPGRVLHWAPAWDDGDAELVFDSASGDYWVLSNAAADLLRRISAAYGPGDPLPVDEAEELLTELQRSGLVDPMA